MTGAAPVPVPHVDGRAEHHGRDLVLRIQRGVAAGGGIGACAEAAPHLDLGRDLAAVKRLRISVADDEVAALDLLLEHVVHGVATAAAHSDDGDLGLLGRHPARGLDLYAV